jgi:hypothetical protein
LATAAAATDGADEDTSVTAVSTADNRGRQTQVVGDMGGLVVSAADAKWARVTNLAYGAVKKSMSVTIPTCTGASLLICLFHQFTKINMWWRKKQCTETHIYAVFKEITTRFFAHTTAANFLERLTALTQIQTWLAAGFMNLPH